MKFFKHRYENTYIAILLFFFFAFALQCNKVVVNTPENEVTTGEMTDIDGNVYKTIKIGNQIWMAENLRVTRYNDGEKINQIHEIVALGFDTIGAYSFYNNTKNTDSIKMYGALYSNYAPAGWHVPSKEEWEELKTFLISNHYNWDKSSSGNIGKSLAAQTGWDTISEPGFIGNDVSQNNATSFCAFPVIKKCTEAHEPTLSPRKITDLNLLVKNVTGGHHQGIYQVPGFMEWDSAMIG